MRWRWCKKNLKERWPQSSRFWGGAFCAASNDASKKKQKGREDDKKNRVGVDTWRQVRKRSGGGTRVLDVSMLKIYFSPMRSRWRESGKSSVTTGMFQETFLDERISVGELYETHKLGMLRFYLFTESLTSRDEVLTAMEEGVDK